jgi:gamma-glutamyltranspeptidase/glutathione hydrolase
MLKKFLLMFVVTSVFAVDATISPEVKTTYQQKALVVGEDSMVVTNNPWASKAAQTILDEDGNAIDAAIAAGFVLGLTEPQSSGIGGGGYALTYMNHKMLAYDGREVAPRTANPNWFLDKDGEPLDFDVAYKTALAIGVPGEVAMFKEMHQRQGKLAWDKILQPAIDLATNGFPMSPRLYGLLQSEKKSLPNLAGAKELYYMSNNEPKPVGTIIKNPAYAKSLKRIANNPDDFYHGQLARDIIQAINKKAGTQLYKADDLANYKVLTYSPVCSWYRNKYKICSVPPSSSGGVTLEELLLIYANVSKVDDVKNPDWEYYFLEASKLAFADRNQYLADPDFVKQPIKGLLDKSYVSSRSKLITNTALATPVTPGVPDGIDKIYAPDISPKKPGTTSLAIVDSDGNAVSMTVTIENQFGSHTFVDGFLLNNQLTDFSFEPSKDGKPIANRVQPGKRPRSSIAPTLVFDRENHLTALAGSPGGSQIICYVAKSLILMLDMEQDPLEAGSYGNLCATNNTPVFESGTDLVKLIPEMNKRGDTIKQQDLVSGEVNIMRTDDGWVGAADPRREGVAIGE